MGHRRPSLQARPGILPASQAEHQSTRLSWLARPGYPGVLQKCSRWDKATSSYKVPQTLLFLAGGSHGMLSFSSCSTVCLYTADLDPYFFPACRLRKNLTSVVCNSNCGMAPVAACATASSKSTPNQGLSSWCAGGSTRFSEAYPVSWVQSDTSRCT